MSPKDRPLVVAAALGGEKLPQLWRMNPDGTARQRLTRERLPCRQPYWNREGNLITYGLDTGQTNTFTGESVLKWLSCSGSGSQRKPSRAPQIGSALPNKLEIEVTGDLVESFRVPGGPSRKILLSPAAAAFWEETGISGGALRLVALPGTTEFVLAVQLAGGNREGKWHTAVKVELATGKAEPWGQYGFSGFAVSPDGRQFITCFNRMVNQKEEHALYLGNTATPRKLTRILTSKEMLFADWRGGKRVL